MSVSLSRIEIQLATLFWLLYFQYMRSMRLKSFFWLNFDVTYLEKDEVGNIDICLKGRF